MLALESIFDRSPPSQIVSSCLQGIQVEIAYDSRFFSCKQ